MICLAKTKNNPDLNRIFLNIFVHEMFLRIDLHVSVCVCLCFSHRAPTCAAHASTFNSAASVSAASMAAASAAATAVARRVRWAMRRASRD